MEITCIKPIVVAAGPRGDWVFIEVETDAGITGLGEASHSSHDELLIATVHRFSEYVVGSDPRCITAITDSLRRVDGGRIAATALSAIEMALWDILGQALGAPIHSFFGGAVRQSIRLYANINRHVTDRSPSGFAQAAAKAVKDGFAAIKLAPFDEVTRRDRARRGTDASWRQGVERVRAVREAIGAGIELMVDCHGRFEESEAETVARELEGLTLTWYEEPVHRRHTDDLARIAQAVSMPIASGESIFGLEGFRPFLEKRIADVLMPDVKHCGGIAELARIAHAARLRNLLIAPHNPSGPVATVASGHVCAGIPNFQILEYAWGEIPERKDLLIPAEPVADGCLHLSDRPGLGHALNRDTVHALQK